MKFQIRHPSSTPYLRLLCVVTVLGFFMGVESKPNLTNNDGQKEAEVVAHDETDDPEILNIDNDNDTNAEENLDGRLFLDGIVTACLPTEDVPRRACHRLCGSEDTCRFRPHYKKHFCVCPPDVDPPVDNGTKFHCKDPLAMGFKQSCKYYCHDYKNSFSCVEERNGKKRTRCVCRDPRIGPMKGICSPNEQVEKKHIKACKSVCNDDGSSCHANRENIPTDKMLCQCPDGEGNNPMLNRKKYDCEETPQATSADGNRDRRLEAYCTNECPIIETTATTLFPRTFRPHYCRRREVMSLKMPEFVCACYAGPIRQQQDRSD